MSAKTPDHHQASPSSTETGDGFLKEWNTTSYPHPLSKCVHELFEQQAALSPDAIAVECNGCRLTFRELNERANSVARVLRKRGVGPNLFVGISVERSVEMVVGIYGILKAGGAYVPLDPVYPQSRLAYMLETARIRILLTQDRLASLFSESEGVEIIRLDTGWPAISQEPCDDLQPAATPDHLIYLIFTSGSTGRPKAAAVYHRGFTNLLLWFVTEFDITDADRNLLVSSLSFDLTQKNLYAPIIKGGQLHLGPPGPYDPGNLTRVIRDHGITLINCTPSAFYPLIEPPSDEAFSRLASMRIAFLGGEPISISRLRPWMTHSTCQAEVANTYGPTECTDICGSYRMTRENMDRYGFVPLGRPIHNVQLAIVDAQFNLCPVGEPGELCVAGAGIGAGYINDPDLTAAKFIANPFPEISGSTIYRTGDQARWLPDGIIEFLGRLDHQVKIRGMRIELHEIENVLSSHPLIREAVVVVKRGPGGDEGARLVCYAMPQAGADPNAGELSSSPLTGEVGWGCCTSLVSTLPQPLPSREGNIRASNSSTLGAGPDLDEIRKYVAGRLPAYMVPAAFYLLSELPLSPNGKVDRNALQNAPEPGAPAVEHPSRLPESVLEQQIRQIWMDVIGLSHVGIHDNFFDIGGNSIQLAQVHVRLQALVHREFPITELFVYTTIHTIAVYLGEDSKPELVGAGAIQDRARRQREAQSARRKLGR